MSKVYAGIGSRETPEDVLQLMFIIGRELAKHGYTLRSGGADGADSAFEKGCDKVHGAKVIYLPWPNFNGHSSHRNTVSQEAQNLTSHYHPAWDRLSQGAKKLMGRNAYQVLGDDLVEPADFIVCWTPDGAIKGGTGQAIRMAQEQNIPIVNLYGMSDSDVENALSALMEDVPEPTSMEAYGSYDERS